MKEPKTKYTWKIYKITNGAKTYVGLTSQSLQARFSQHKKAAKEMHKGVSTRTKKHLPYTRKFYGDLVHGNWKIELLEQVKGDHAKALRIERRMKKKHETYDGFSQLEKKHT